jgi:tetratricopeptide (TPR) repeat protein
MRSLISALCLCLPLASTAQTTQDRAAAREAFRRGQKLYEVGDFRGALAAFKKAYLEVDDPAFLFNIAQCLRQSGDKAEALRTYRMYLVKLPQARNRAQTEKIIVDLQAAIDAEKAEAARAAERERAREAVEKSTAAPPPTVATPTTAATDTADVSATATPKPVHRRAWVWGVVAGGAVVVAGAITLGVVLGTRNGNFVELTY